MKLPCSFLPVAPIEILPERLKSRPFRRGREKADASVRIPLTRIKNVELDLDYDPVARAEGFVVFVLLLSDVWGNDSGVGAIG